MRPSKSSTLSTGPHGSTARASLCPSTLHMTRPSSTRCVLSSFSHIVATSHSLIIASATIVVQARCRLDGGLANVQLHAVQEGRPLQAHHGPDCRLPREARGRQGPVRRGRQGARRDLRPVFGWQCRAGLEVFPDCPQYRLRVRSESGRVGDRQGSHEVLPVRPPCLLFTICPAKVPTLNQHLHTERLTSRSARSTPTWPRRPFSRTPASTVRLASSPSRSPHLDLTLLFLSFCLDPIARRMIAKDLGVEL